MRRFAWALVVSAALSGAAIPVLGSDPIGVYAIVDRVVLEPESGLAERAQIWGAFSIARGRFGVGDLYDPPVRGYFYYSLPEGQEELTRIEWADLESVAGTGKCVAFGSRYEPPVGRVRPGCEEPAKPDVYPLTQGIQKVRTDTAYPPINGLVSMPTPVSPEDGAEVKPGPVTLTVQNVLDPARAGALYLFEITSSSGATEESLPVPAGEGLTSWTPSLPVQPGGQYTWRAQAAEGGWGGPPAIACFEVAGLPFLRGDSNGDDEVDLSDAVYVLIYLFNGGPTPDPLEAGDADGNGTIEITDSIYLLSYLFLGGPAPPGPFPSQG
ncbi:MAG: hypothetical protein HY721_01770 [Planctomycetes bacterium]|nr:hypothetical protein [Planctomycetota bacterium]